MIAHLTRLAVKAVMKQRGEAERPGPSTRSPRKKPRTSSKPRRRKIEQRGQPRPPRKRWEPSAKAQRRENEQPSPSSSAPQQDPTLWERYQKRWPDDHGAEDRKLIQSISGQSEAEKTELQERFLRKETWMRWDQTPAMTRTEPEPLPRSLTPKDQAAPDAAQSVWNYADTLPQRYRQQWDKTGIGRRADEVAEQARTSLRGKLSRNPEKLAEAAVRQECGPQAQQFDRQMRQDMEQHRPQWKVLTRLDTLQGEEQRARWDTAVRESLEQSRRAGDRATKRKDELEPERDQVDLSRLGSASHAAARAADCGQGAARAGGARRARICMHINSVYH